MLLIDVHIVMTYLRGPLLKLGLTRDRGSRQIGSRIEAKIGP
jgi:hypothetical protein